MQSRFLVAALAFISLAVAIRSEAQASSVGRIYGTWVPIRYTPNPNLPGGITICNSRMVFTAKNSTVWLGVHPEWGGSSTPVQYLDRVNGKVGVLGNGGEIEYDFIDNNHMMNPADVVRCVYERR